MIGQFSGKHCSCLQRVIQYINIFFFFFFFFPTGSNVSMCGFPKEGFCGNYLSTIGDKKKKYNIKEKQKQQVCYLFFVFWVYKTVRQLLNGMFLIISVRAALTQIRIRPHPQATANQREAPASDVTGPPARGGSVTRFTPSLWQLQKVSHILF